MYERYVRTLTDICITWLSKRFVYDDYLTRIGNEFCPLPIVYNKRY